MRIDKQINRHEQPLLTPRQVAAMANYQTAVSVLRAFRRGELPGYKLNARTIRFHPDDVAQWLDYARVGNARNTSPVASGKLGKGCTT
jgi:hypothetical protein